MTTSPGFGSVEVRDTMDDKSSRLASYRIWKKLFQPEHTYTDPSDPYRVYYSHINQDVLAREQMARRMDRKVIKLEAAFGSDRQSIVIKRNQDLIVQDLMEDIQRIFKIPIEEQVIFHKGTNLCDFIHETLENLGVENNNPIRITRDPELPKRSPRSKQNFVQAHFANGQMPPNVYQNQPIDSLAYLREVSPQRMPDLSQANNQFQFQNVPSNTFVNKNSNQNEVIKLYVSFGSEREYILVNGKKPLMIYDLKLEISRQFKVPPDQQCIVFKGYNLHDYMDDAPLEAFGLENNSPISLWPKGGSNQDLRLPRGPSPPPQLIADIFSPRVPPPPPGQNRWPNVGLGATNEPVSEVLKIEVQHGSDRHMIVLKGQNKTLTVLDLQNELEKLTSVPVREQRLFYKAMEIHTTPFKTLKEYDIENNHLIKLVGEPSKVRYSNYFGRLNVAGAPNNDGSSQMLGQQYNPTFQQQGAYSQRLNTNNNYGNFPQNF